MKSVGRGQAWVLAISLFLGLAGPLWSITPNSEGWVFVPADDDPHWWTLTIGPRAGTRTGIADSIDRAASLSLLPGALVARRFVPLEYEDRWGTKSNIRFAAQLAFVLNVACYVAAGGIVAFATQRKG